jgi:hypothetical protein
MSKKLGFQLLLAVGLTSLAISLHNGAGPALAAEPIVDLGIGDESRGRPNIRADADQVNYNRPAILIAWRNTAQILEVEVLVTNKGLDQGQGKVHVEVLDEYGRMLARMPTAGQDVLVTVPARDEGGKQGILAQIGGSKVLNKLIDRLDRDHSKYYIKAVVETIGKDQNPLDNAKVKSYNRDFRARPGSVHFFDYFFTNTTDRPLALRWYLDMSPLPKGWEMEARPAPGNAMTLAPNQSIQGNIIVRTPREIIEGDRVEIRMSGINVDNEIITQTEWHLVNDNDPPEIISPSIVATQDGSIELELTAHDILSGIYEASGVKGEYSTDGGATYSTRVISYVYGSFVNPTLFKTKLGPFAENAEVQVTLSVMDTAGNVERTPSTIVRIPEKIKKQAQAQ